MLSGGDRRPRAAEVRDLSGSGVVPPADLAPPAPVPRVFWRWAFAAVALLVLMVGLSPVPLPVVFDLQDKLLHVVGFAALVLSARLAFPRVPLLWLVVASLSLALFIELAQAPMVGRSASMRDMVADVVGVALGLLLARLVQRRG